VEVTKLDMVILFFQASGSAAVALLLRESACLLPLG
jgi:hypothetical protein